MKSFILSPKIQFILMVLSLCSNATDQAWGYSDREDNEMIANGQGVSSPSFFGGLNGENPAGLASNQSFKLQGGFAAFNQELSTPTRGSGALLMGNGMLGAGIEYSTFNSSPYPNGSAEIDWGVAGRFSTLETTIGVSGHQVVAASGTNWSNAGNYDIGALFEPFRTMRVGAMVPNFNHGLRIAAGGITWLLGPRFDFVVDAAYHLLDKAGTIKPGLSIHSNRIQLSAAYGARMLGSEDVFLNTGFTGGIGLKITNALLVEYQYRALPQHWLGLTLRF